MEKFIIIVVIVITISIAINWYKASKKPSGESKGEGAIINTPNEEKGSIGDLAY